MIKKIQGPNRLQLVLDSSQIFPDDPGNGTPAMVYRMGRGVSIAESATFWCAQGEDALSDDSGIDQPLRPEESKWLASVECHVDAMFAESEAATK